MHTGAFPLHGKLCRCIISRLELLFLLSKPSRPPVFVACHTCGQVRIAGETVADGLRVSDIDLNYSTLYILTTITFFCSPPSLLPFTVPAPPPHITRQRRLHILIHFPTSHPLFHSRYRIHCDIHINSTPVSSVVILPSSSFAAYHLPILILHSSSLAVAFAILHFPFLLAYLL